MKKKLLYGIVGALLGLSMVPIYMYNVERTMEKELGIKDFWNLRGEREIPSATAEITIPTPVNLETIPE